MDSSDWLNGIRYHTFDTIPDTEFKVTLPLIRDFDQKSLRIDLFRYIHYISREFLGPITQERKSLLLCALCANHFGRLSPRRRCLQW